MRRVAKLVTLLPFLVFACSATGSSKDTANDGSKGPGGNGAAGSDAGNGFDDTFDGGEDDPAAAVAHLKGRVYAPEGTIPISGALVYLSPTPPPDIPDGAYCDKCVELDKSIAYTFTAPSGQFDLGARQLGEQYLIVQKGQFRRVRRFVVEEGEQDVPKELTTFPNKTSKAYGDTIPKMAIITGAWDAVDVSLAKLGLGKTAPTGFMGKEEVDRATAPFDYYENTWPPGGANSPDSILKDPSVISKYHIIFKPCSGSDGTTCNDFVPDNKEVQDNLRNYVNKGGKLYATDYSYEYVRRTWPGYINWQGEGSATGSACNGGGSNGPAEVPDPGLGSWLEAMGHKSWEIQGAWTGINKVNPVNALDVDGNPATITPKIWVNSKASGRPATVSFESGCGRVMFSTYHTEVGEAEAIPQQMALLYVLLEVGVCVAPPVVK